MPIQQSFQKYVRKCFKFWKTELTGQSASHLVNRHSASSVQSIGRDSQPVYRTVNQSVTKLMCIIGMQRAQNYALLGAKWIGLRHAAPPLDISICILHSPMTNNPPSAFIHYSGKQSHLLCYPLSSHPPRYGTSTPAPTPFLSD